MEEERPLAGGLPLPCYLHVGRLGDEVDGYPVQHILGAGISKRGHIIRKAVALQEAPRFLRCELTRDGSGQSCGEEEEVEAMRVLFIPTVFTDLNNTRALSGCFIFSVQTDHLTEAKLSLTLRNLG